MAKRVISSQMSRGKPFWMIVWYIRIWLFRLLHLFIQIINLTYYLSGAFFAYLCVCVFFSLLFFLVAHSEIYLSRLSIYLHYIRLFAIIESYLTELSHNQHQSKILSIETIAWQIVVGDFFFFLVVFGGAHICSVVARYFLSNAYENHFQHKYFTLSASFQFFICFIAYINHFHDVEMTHLVFRANKCHSEAMYTHLENVEWYSHESIIYSQWNLYVCAPVFRPTRTEFK